MQLIPVSNKKLAKGFLEVPTFIYKNDPNYIRPLDKDIEAVFDPKKNKSFRHGEVERWILKNNDDESIGRIAAFVNQKYKNKGDRQKTGGIGFFECINDQNAADILFDVAKSWLMERGMEAMDGPINFGERDRWWGLVVEGYKPPIYLMNYNPPYYVGLFENYGFKNFFNQICWSLPVKTTLGERFEEMNEKYASDPDFEAHYINKNDLEKFAEDFCVIYNRAWATHEGNKELKTEHALKMFKSMKAVMDEKLIWFTYYRREPIAFWINLPELNQIFKHFKGRFGIIEKIRFLWMRWRMKNTKFTGIVFGVVPEFQGKGVDYFMIMQGASCIQDETHYTECELQWQGDFNPKILNISKHLGAEKSRMLTTYRYLFDRAKKFERHPILE
ncbi:hypothetical protein [Paracoccus sp. (in: a-proteobacteria)]|uniref:hypothetical protein n=1 Tax=Paracoccus sp. TaxID=267 RepID=UPI002AFEF887|nr:hypothetical protein [Paracoccus sp. (in: a-proteobacteria)]